MQSMNSVVFRVKKKNTFCLVVARFPGGHEALGVFESGQQDEYSMDTMLTGIWRTGWKLTILALL